MVANYTYERTTVTLQSGTPVTLVPSPPPGVAYRIFHVDGHNNEAATKVIVGKINDGSNLYTVYRDSALTNESFVQIIATSDLPSQGTICVLDSTNESFEVELIATGSITTTGTFIVGCSYEILETEGERTVRNTFATTNGTTPVELIPVPRPNEVYRVLKVNGNNDSGGTRTMHMNVGTDSGASKQGVGKFTVINTFPFFYQFTGWGTAWPNFVLSSATDSLEVELSGTGALLVSAHYEVHTSRTPR